MLAEPSWDRSISLWELLWEPGSHSDERVMLMFRKFLIALIISGLLAVPCFADFRFAVLGDTRDYSSDGINVRVMKAILEKIKAENVDFIIIIGDMITGSTKTDVHRNRLKKWKSIIEKYRIPFYVGVGNHEIESEVSEDIVRSVFEMPENGPSGLKELIYSFDYKNSHFIMLDTAIFNSFHALGKVQMGWLKEDLEKNQKKPIFIFGHDPAYPVYSHIGTSLDKYSIQRDELWSLFERHKVRIYFCGHEHLYNRSIHGDVYQVITAGGGAHLAAPEEKGGFYNFAVVEVKDDGLALIAVKDIKGSVKDIFNIEY